MHNLPPRTSPNPRASVIQIPKFLLWYTDRSRHLVQMCPPARKHQVSVQSLRKASRPDLLMLLPFCFEELSEMKARCLTHEPRAASTLQSCQMPFPSRSSLTASFHFICDKKEKEKNEKPGNSIMGSVIQKQGGLGKAITQMHLSLWKVRVSQGSQCNAGRDMCITQEAKLHPE